MNKKDNQNTSSQMFLNMTLNEILGLKLDSKNLKPTPQVVVPSTSANFLPSKKLLNQTMNTHENMEMEHDTGNTSNIH